MGRVAVTAAIVAVLGATAAAAQVRYQLVFEATWSAQTHPTDFPPGPHFSAPVGGTHKPSVVFWEPGGLASDGIEAMAERGVTGTLVNEILDAAQQDHASSTTIVGSGFSSPGTVSLQFDITQQFPQLTLVSMLAPSPDWFVGVGNFDLFRYGRWRDGVTVTLFTYDAGTDSGSSYTSANLDTVPAEPVVKIDTPPLADATGYQPPVGTYSLTIVSVDGRPPYGDADGDGLTNLREIELGTDPTRTDTDGDGRPDSLDNCPTAENASQGDVDADGVGDACDNCPLDPNPAQTDSNLDLEGDRCDLDDGVIYIQFSQPGLVAWQDEAGFDSWNSYRGDLRVLRDNGLYTQDPLQVPLAARTCGLDTPWLADDDPPQAQATFFLTTGIFTGTSTESSLGTDSDGVERANTMPCP